MCQWCGATCPYCGHSPEAPLVKPEPAGAGPGDSALEYACRYGCGAVFSTAEECSRHQAARHVGVGLRTVNDLVELHPVK